jgi:hypothetical protein
MRKSTFSMLLVLFLCSFSYANLAPDPFIVFMPMFALTTTLFIEVGFALFYATRIKRLTKNNKRNFILVVLTVTLTTWLFFIYFLLHQNRIMAAFGFPFGFYGVVILLEFLIFLVEAGAIYLMAKSYLSKQDCLIFSALANTFSFVGGILFSLLYLLFTSILSSLFLFFNQFFYSMDRFFSHDIHLLTLDSFTPAPVVIVVIVLFVLAFVSRANDR